MNFAILCGDAPVIPHCPRRLLIMSCVTSLCLASSAQHSTAANPTKRPVSKVWVADNGDGTYKNPVLHADYSDPDVVRVGDDFYLTASSFNAAPGLPILHSKDLVSKAMWTSSSVTRWPSSITVKSTPSPTKSSI
jgi:hypothetical protein